VEHLTCALLLVAAGRKPPDAAVVCREAAEDRDAADASGMMRTQSGANFDAGMQGEVSPESMGKTAPSAVETAPERDNGDSPNYLGTLRDQSRLRPCAGKPFELSNQLQLESQKEIVA
jgi:hypothetical protein